MAYDAIMTIGIAGDDAPFRRTLKHISTDTSKTLSQAIKAHTQPLGRITGEANEFQKSLAASNARVIAFGASTGIIFALKSAFELLVKSTIDVQREMTEVNSVFRLSSQQLKSFSNDLFALSNNYGVSFGEASKAAVEFARQGNNVVETLKRTGAALALARISGLGMEESVNSLTSILNTFQKEGLEAMDVINRLTAVDQNFAISAGAMADALSRVSSSASDANVSLNETMGLIAAAKQITGRSGSVLGNSFKTIFTRLQRPEVLDDLESVGVKARDAEGKVRPMIDVLRALSSTYDGLAGSQKSFVAETVGGIYQINTLKAIMQDLGSTMSIFDGALRVAGESSDFVNQRMEVLNETISSQLIRTANNLKLAFYNVGTSLIAGPLNSGLQNFDSLVRSVGKYTDPNTAKEGDTGEKATANAAQGILKGVANFAAGPGLQFLMTTLLKLFEKLDSFIIQSAKDLTGINQQEKQREALNQGISEWLATQKNLLSDILTGTTSINSAMQKYITDMKGAVSTANNLKSVTDAIGTRAITQVTFTGSKTAAGGFIPSLEIAEARRGGYQAGRVLNTKINDGNQSVDIVANSAESVTTIVKDGKKYDFVNPPLGSPAANLHRRESLRQTGIDPYELPKMEMKAKGAIPNLALSPEMVQTIMALGVKPQEVVEKARLSRLENFTSLPEELVGTFVSRYRHDQPSLMAALVSLTKKGANIPFNNGPAMAKFLSGFMLNPLAKEKGLFPDMSPAAISTLTESLTGKEAQSPKAAMAKLAKLTHLRPDDVQKVFDLHSKSFPFIAGYESSNDLSHARDRADLVSSIDFPTNPDTKEMRTFKIATPIYGFKGDVASQFKRIEAMMLAEAGSNEPFTPAEIGATRGVFFDKKLRTMAQKEGVPVGEAGSALDIYGPVKSILSQTNIKSPVAGMELKASAIGATDSGNMAEKIFRVLAGEPGTGNREPALKGPTAYVPKLKNIQQFNSKAGGIGIIDADKYGQDAVTDAAFSSIIYAAVASGKPLRIHYGPMTMGKTTAAEHIVERAGGLGAAGGDYITDINQINTDAFKQFIINKTDRKNLDSGVFGLALSSASQVRAFFSPYAEYKAKHEEMVKRLRERNRGKEGKNAEAIANTYDEKAWSEYDGNISHLTKKLGTERVSTYDQGNPFAAKGRIPNLSVVDANKKLVGLAQNGILSREIAARARNFVNSTPITSTKGNSVDREYLIAALYNRAQGKPVGGDMKIINSVLGISESMFDVLSDGFMNTLKLPDLKKRVEEGDLGYSASGFVPNLYSEISDALNRENKATGGHAMLSRDSMLRTSQNPLGLAAIDSRIQKDAGQAIRQHMSLGQSLGEVRQANTARGRVPNLAISTGAYDDPFNNSSQGTFSSIGMIGSLALSLASAVKQEVKGPARLLDNKVATDGSWLSQFASEGARAAAKLRLLEEEFSNARENLVKERTVELSPLAGGRKINGARKDKLLILDIEAEKVFSKYRPEASKYQNELNNTATRASKVGLRTATIASIGGGIATQFAESVNPSLGAAVNEFSNGATQAGQILLTFPSKFGWIGGLTVAGAAAISAVDVWRRGMANAVRNFELTHNRLDQLNSQLDSLALSINGYDSVVMDASVTLKAIEATQRQYRETLAQLENSDEGKKFAEKLKGSPDAKSQIALLLENKQKNVKEDNLAQSILAVKKYADTRSYLGRGLYGVKQLGYSNLTQQKQVEGIVRSNAGSLISSMSDGLKSLLSSTTNIEDFTSSLNDAVKNPDKDISESAKEIAEAVRSLAEKLDDTSLGEIKQNVVNQLRTEAEDNTPEREKKLSGLKYRNAERKADTENALNYSRLQQRLFVNSGALNAANQINVRDVRNQTKYNDATANGKDSVALRQANAGVYRLQYGERTVRAYETATEIKRISADKDFKINQVENDSLRNALGTLTQNFDQRINNPEQYKNANKPGGATPTISTFDVTSLSQINQGIAETAKKGFANFTTKGGRVDTDKLISSIAENSGASAKEQEGIVTYLKANIGNVDIAKAQLDTNKQVVSILQDSNTEIQKQTTALEGFNREADFKELAGYMGGIKNLLDRNSRRTLERNLVRGAYLMEHGKTSEAKATGASLYLESLKSMGKSLDPNKNTALSRSIAQAYNTLIPNLADVQSKSVGRVANNRVVGNGLFGSALGELASQNTIKSATAAALNEYPIEDKNVASGAIGDISDTALLFRKELRTSTKSLEDFALSIDTLRSRMIGSQIEAAQTRARNEKASDADSKTTSGGVKGFGQATRPTVTGGKDTGAIQRFGVGGGEILNNIVLAGIGLAGTYYAKKYIGQGYNKVKNIRANRASRISDREIQLETNLFGGVEKITDVDSYNAAKKAKIQRIKSNNRILNSRPKAPNEPVVDVSTLSEGNSVPAPEPPVSKPQTAAERSAEYKRRKALAKQRKDEAYLVKKQAEATRRQQQQEYANRFFQPKIVTPETLDEISARNFNQLANDLERKIDSRNSGKLGGVNSRGNPTPEALNAKRKVAPWRERISFTKENYSAFKETAKGTAKGAAILGLATLGVSALTSKAKAQGVGEDEQEESNPAISGGDIARTGVSAGINAYFLKTPEIKRLAALKKGIGLAGVGLAADKLEEALGGGVAGKSAGAALNIGGAFKFFGAKGGIGAGIGIASEELRNNYTEKKFGYGAGVGQGLLGAAAASAPLGPVGAVVGSGLYLAGESLQVNSDTNDAIGQRRNLDANSILKDSRDLNGTTEDNIGIHMQKLLSRLTGREGELKSRKQTDEEDFKGFYGNVSRVFSARQFGASESKQLSQITAQKNKLGAALNSGDTKEMLKVLQEIQLQLEKQAREVNDPEAKTQTTGNQTNSQINVDISVKDLDRIPSEINDSVIAPLVEQISQLQFKVNELINQRSPRPASV